MPDPLARLANPRDGRPLTEVRLVDGIADLLAGMPLEGALAQESEVFETLPIEGVCYFREELFDQVLAILGPHLTGLPPVMVEIGGGEGYFADAWRQRWGGDGYVCDLSRRALGHAVGKGLGAIRCDARRPYLVAGSVGLAAFWVSLHHFGGGDRRAALETAVATLAPRGLLVVFEPNDRFLPRRLFQASPLSRLVYFEHEEPLASLAVDAELATLGMERVLLHGINPPYSARFLRHFRLWPLFLAGTEALHLMDRVWPRSLGLGWGSYAFGVYRKSAISTVLDIDRA